MNYCPSLIAWNSAVIPGALFLPTVSNGLRISMSSLLRPGRPNTCSTLDVSGHLMPEAGGYLLLFQRYWMQAVFPGASWEKTSCAAAIVCGGLGMNLFLIG